MTVDRSERDQEESRSLDRALAEIRDELAEGLHRVCTYAQRINEKAGRRDP